MSADLRVEELRKQFTSCRPAVDGVSFHVSAGEIVVLLGPSGCGKTTTLRCVAGLENATGGRIRIAGRLVSAPEDGVMVNAMVRLEQALQEAYQFASMKRSRWKQAVPQKSAACTFPSATAFSIRWMW